MLLRQSALYLLANVVAASLGFLSVIVLTRLVGPAVYGSFVLVMSLGTVLSTIFFTWQRHAILRYQSEQAADVRLSLLAGYMLTLALHPVALVALIYIMRVPVEKGLAAVMLAAAGAFYELGQEVLRARQLVPAYVRGVIVRSLASLSFCLVAVWLGAGGLGLVSAVALAYVFSAAISARAVWAAPCMPADRATLVRLARYGVPITFSGAFVALTLALDRFVLYTLIGTEAVGIYGAAADFVRQCAVLPAISASFALAPLAVAGLRSETEGTTRGHLTHGAELLLAVMLPVAVGLAIAAPQVAGTIFGPQYRAVATDLIPILAFAFLAHSISQQYVQLSFSLAEKPQLFIVHTGSIFVINLILMVPLVKLFGVTGAAISLLVSELAGVVVGIVLFRWAYPMPMVTEASLRIVLAAAAMALVCLPVRQLVERTDVVGLIAVVASGALTYAAAVVILDIADLRSAAGRRFALWRNKAGATGR